MHWLVLSLIVAIALIALGAYFYFEKKGWFQGEIESGSLQLQSSPFQLVDILFCIVLVIYFLTIIATPEGNGVLNLQEVQAGTIFYLLLDLIIISFLLLRRINPLKAFGLYKLRWWEVIKTAVIWLVILYPLIFLVQILVEHFAGKDATPQPLVKFLMENPRLFDRVTVGLLAVVIAPFTEELIFRGYLYGVIRKYAGRLAAIFLSACLFAGIHQHWPAFPGLFLLAIVLSFAYETTGSLLVPMLMHAFFNLIGVFAAVFLPKVF